jgi:hypothetical protein
MKKLEFKNNMLYALYVYLVMKNANGQQNLIYCSISNVWSNSCNGAYGRDVEMQLKNNYFSGI